MAYGKKYITKWYSENQNHRFRAEIWEDGFVGDTETVEASSDTCGIAWESTSSDNNVLNPIKALKANLNLLSSSTLNLYSFYSDVDEHFRIDIYCERNANGVPGETLLFTGFLINDDSSEDFQDTVHNIELQANDNLPLLRDVKLDECDFDGGVEGKKTLIDIIQRCLEKTGLSLELNAYVNIFENTTDDRGDDTAADYLQQTLVDTAMFAGTDGVYRDCYSVLSQVMADTNSCLFQANGRWNINRPAEYLLFTNGAVKGTNYLPDGTATAADNLLPAVTVGKNKSVEPEGEDQIKTLVRPVKYSKQTFDYNYPDKVIRNLDLQELGDLRTSFADGDNTVYQYDLPWWSLDTRYYSTPDYDFYVEVIKDANDVEIDRRMVVYADGVTVLAQCITKGVWLNAGDRVQLSFDFRAEDSFTGPTTRTMEATIDDGEGTNNKLSYNASGHVDGSWSTTGGIVASYASGEDIAEWRTITVQSDNIPFDGWFNFWPSQNNHNGGRTFYKNMKVEYTSYINETTRIIGQEHTQEQATLIKNRDEYEVSMDDSPRNIIAGTLLTDDLTTFSDPLPNNPSSDYVTKTTWWHRLAISETLRLGQILVNERMVLKSTMKTSIEGTFANLYKDEFISPLTLFSFPDIVGVSKFLAEKISMNLARGTMSIKFIEIGSEGEGSYAFNYKFQIG